MALKTAGLAGTGALALKSPAITQPPQVCFNGLLQFCGLGELGVQFGDEARHLFLEGLAVVFDFLGTDIATGREDVAVRGDFGGGGGFAEARDVTVAGVCDPGPDAPVTAELATVGISRKGSARRVPKGLRASVTPPHPNLRRDAGH